MVFTATLLNGTGLPAWLAFDEATGTLSGTPANDDVGEYSIRVAATDAAGESAADDFVLRVVNVNDAPTLAVPVQDRSFESGSELTLALDAGMFTDVDPGDSLAYRASRADGSALPQWLIFDGPARTFSGAPGDSDAGTIDVRVSATDLAGAGAFDEFRITVVGAEPDGEYLVGTKRADTLVGTAHGDVLDGRRGDDRLYGGEGNDVYRYSEGDGDDVILESGGLDTLRFGDGLRARDVVILRRHGDLVLKVKGERGSVAIKGWFDAPDRRVERLEFADGRSWDAADLHARARFHEGDSWWNGPAEPDCHGASRRERESNHGGGAPEGRGMQWDEYSRLRDSSDAIRLRLERRARYDFGALVEYLRHSHARSSSTMPSDGIAEQWAAVRRAVGDLHAFDDGSNRGWNVEGAGEAMVLQSDESPSWGHAGSTGRRHGASGMAILAGLGEGFRNLG
jgi:hypothetical protein